MIDVEGGVRLMLVPPVTILNMRTQTTVERNINILPFKAIISSKSLSSALAVDYIHNYWPRFPDSQWHLCVCHEGGSNLDRLIMRTSDREGGDKRRGAAKLSIDDERDNTRVDRGAEEVNRGGRGAQIEHGKGMEPPSSSLFEHEDIPQTEDAESASAESGGKKRKLLSKIWDDYTFIPSTKVGEVDKAKCKHCDKVYNAISRNGTTTMTRHREKHKTIQSPVEGSSCADEISGLSRPLNQEHIRFKLCVCLISVSIAAA
ncbi:hypothetical protein Dimus_026561 [Dionaea muscipula]